MLTPALLHAAYDLQLELFAQERIWDQAQAQAQTLLDQGEVRAAITAFEQLLALSPGRVMAWYHLAQGYVQDQRLEQAMQTLQQALALAREHAPSHHLWGQILRQIPNPQPWQTWYDQKYAEGGGRWLAQGNLTQALVWYRQTNPPAFDNLAFVYGLLGDMTQALRYQGHALRARGDLLGAVRAYQAVRPTAQIYLDLTACLVAQGAWEEALALYPVATTQFPDQEILFLQWVQHLHQAGATVEAIEIATQAQSWFPNSLGLAAKRLLLVPILYADHSELDRYRAQFRAGLAEFIAFARSLEPQLRWQGLADLTNFYPPYQGFADVDLACAYGTLLTETAQACVPHQAGVPAGSRIRVGYMSHHFNLHTVGKLALGWFQHHDRQDFEIFTYSMGDQTDLYTQAFAQASEHFIQNESVTALAEQIQRDGLDILVFLDLGMDALGLQLASLRLAGVQCTTWCHPVTSGLPTVDYFLSSDRMEPADGDAHYSEVLIRLPNLGICYDRPILPTTVQTRADFGLALDRVVYLACQSLFKYLPAYDYLYPAIAHQVPHAQFVFLAQPSPRINALFQKRLDRAFAEVGLSAADYCVYLPRLSWHHYGRVNQLADIFLDSVGWSGGNTTLEALAWGLPVVTYPTTLMRGRHSYGILQQLGVTATIATNLEEYIAIAARLGLEPAWRAEIRTQIQSQQGRLFGDRAGLRGLEDFYRRVVRG